MTNPPMMQAMRLTARHASLRRVSLAVPAPGPGQLLLRVSACAVCRTDLHVVDGELPGGKLPITPGHEIIGRVLEVGPSVAKFKVGDRAGVGCLVESCHHCKACAKGWEQYCENGATYTYNHNDPIDGTRTYGGYSEKLVVSERVVLKVPDALDMAGAAPLLCAGITTYSPLRHWNVGPGSKVAIVGLGGLGHMGLKLAKAPSDNVGPKPAL